MLDNIDFIGFKNYILGFLQENLSKDLYYHNLSHTIDVYNSVNRIAFLENCYTYSELLPLRTAALLHDVGFIFTYNDHEEEGVRFANEILPKFGYTKEIIDQVEKLIMVTKIGVMPNNIYESIICDADLDYLGRNDFFDISNSLREEFIIYGIVKNEQEWDKLQKGFLNNHHYFTKSSISHRAPQKAIHFEKI